jgi:RNA polymerase sigma-70 factor, ECF subfamily
MSADAQFTDLLARLRAGDQQAAADLFQRYARRMIGLARRHLDGQLRRKVDPEDVMQSVFKSFFHRHAAGAFALENWDSLWALLVTITLRKCGHQLEHFQAACRNLRREETLLAAADSASSWEARGSEPTPLEAALLGEVVEQLLRSQSDERERQIVMMSLQGYTPLEISTAVGRSERTVQRVLSRVQHRLERLRDQPETAG